MRGWNMLYFKHIKLNDHAAVFRGNGLKCSLKVHFKGKLLEEAFLWELWDYPTSHLLLGNLDSPPQLWTLHEKRWDWSVQTLGFQSLINPVISPTVKSPPAGFAFKTGSCIWLRKQTDSDDFKMKEGCKNAAFPEHPGAQFPCRRQSSSDEQ